MDNLTQEVFGNVELVSQVTIYDLCIALASSAVLNFVIAALYTYTHGGYSYSKSFTQTLVLVGVTVTLIMVIIGSDIARAFALVGAMSIVRFRTPVKDPRDLVFVFAGIAVGMACGVQFHVFAVIFTGVMGILVLGFHFLNFGEISSEGYVLRVRVKQGERDRITEVCEQNCKRVAVVSVSRVGKEDVEEIIYEVELKRGVTYSQLMERLNATEAPLSINILVGEGSVNA